MATVPQKDQDLIDQLNKTISDLYSLQEEAARNKNDALGETARNQVSLILGLIDSIIQYHIKWQDLSK